MVHPHCLLEILILKGFHHLTLSSFATANQWLNQNTNSTHLWLVVSTLHILPCFCAAVARLPFSVHSCHHLSLLVWSLSQNVLPVYLVPPVHLQLYEVPSCHFLLPDPCLPVIWSTPCLTLTLQLPSTYHLLSWSVFSTICSLDLFSACCYFPPASPLNPLRTIFWVLFFFFFLKALFWFVFLVFSD